VSKLTIIYGDHTLADNVDVDEFQWSDTATTIAVVAKVKQVSAGSGTSLMNILSAARSRPAKPAPSSSVDDAETEGSIVP
jgi:hypothetical protein